MLSKPQLLQYYKTFETDRIIEDFALRQRCEPQSRTYHVTAVFRPHWFHGRVWSGKTGIARHELIGKFAPDMFGLFRQWWVHGLADYMPNFYRPNKKPLQPVCHAFLDDKGDGEPYPHIHAVCWVPAALVEGFERWSDKSWPNFDELDVRSADETHEHLANTVRYASKYHAKWVLHDSAFELRMSLPA